MNYFSFSAIFNLVINYLYKTFIDNRKFISFKQNNKIKITETLPPLEKHENLELLLNFMFFHKSIETIPLFTFDNIMVYYTYNKENYRILINTKHEINNTKPISVSPKIIQANLFNKNFDKLDVTNYINQYSGPCHDYYLNHPNVSKIIKDILFPIDIKVWNVLELFTSFGQKIILDIDETKQLKLKY